MNLTVAFILAMLAIVVGFDIWVLVTRGAGDTISSVVYRACQRYPIIAAVLGALLYHLVSGAL